jgi:autotransporter passenger strand-loop-strand repeat protein
VGYSGFASGTIVSAGREAILSSGSAADTTVIGGSLTVLGTVSGANISSGSTASVFSGGTLNVLSGNVVHGVTVSGVGTENVSLGGTDFGASVVGSSTKFRLAVRVRYGAFAVPTACTWAHSQVYCRRMCK